MKRYFGNPHPSRPRRGSAVAFTLDALFRLFVLCSSGCSFALSSAHGTEATNAFQALVNRYNLDNRNNDFGDATIAAEAMLKLGRSMNMPANSLSTISLMLAHAKINANDRDGIDDAYAGAMESLLATDSIDIFQLATIFDEWVGIDREWRKLPELERYISDHASSGNVGLFAQLASIYRYGFDFASADRSIRAIDRSRARRDVMLASAVAQNNFAWRNYMLRGEYTVAQAELQFAISFALTGKGTTSGDLAIATISHNLAETLLYLGYRTEAARLARTALASRRKLMGPENIAVAETDLLVARATTEPEEAAQLIDEAILIYRSTKAYSILIDDALILRAGLNRRIKRLDDANKDISQVYMDLEITKKIDGIFSSNPNRVNAEPLDQIVAKTLSEKAEIQSAYGNPAAARVTSTLATLFWRRASDAPQEPLAADKYVATRDLMTALRPEYFKQEIASARFALEDNNTGGAITAMNVIGELSERVRSPYFYFLGGQFTKDWETFGGHSEIADILLASESRTKTANAQSLEYAFFVLQNLSFSATSSVVEMANSRQMGFDDFKASKLYEHTVRELRALTSNWRRQLLSILDNELPDPNAGEVDYPRRVSELLAKASSIKKELHSGALGEADIVNSGATLAPLRGKLRTDEALVGFYCNRDVSYALIIKPDNQSVRMLQASCEKVKELTDELRSNAGIGRQRGPMPLSNSRSARQLVSSAHSLYSTVFEPLEAELKSAHHLIIVAIGPFASVPWSMLVSAAPSAALEQDLSQVQWLARRFSFSVAPSQSAFAELREQHGKTRASRPYFGIGNPILNDSSAQMGSAEVGSISNYFRGSRADLRALRMLPALPETEVEVSRVATALKADDKSILLGPEATEHAVKVLSNSGRLREYRIIHFATHGLISGDLEGLNEPALVLTLPTEVSEDDDGLLTASEVSSLDLSADWAVLSACNTSAGETMSADPLSGLASAFFRAGAKSLLVSQWPVYSDAAVELISSAFNFAQDDQTVDHAEALRLAMVKMIDSGKASPALWAPFFVVGD